CVRTLGLKKSLSFRGRADEGSPSKCFVRALGTKGRVREDCQCMNATDPASVAAWNHLLFIGAHRRCQQNKIKNQRRGNFKAHRKRLTPVFFYFLPVSLVLLYRAHEQRNFFPRNYLRFLLFL